MSNEATTQATRKITIYSSRGGRNTIETDATKWGQIKDTVEDMYDLENMSVMENVNRTILGRNDSVLPPGEFTIFLKPQKTKSGTSTVRFIQMSFKKLAEFMEENKKFRKYVKSETGDKWKNIPFEDLQDFFEEFDDSDDTLKALEAEYNNLFN